MRSVCAAGAMLAVVLVFAASANATAPEFMLRIFNGQVARGSGAGELDWPSGVVADPDTGHLFVSEAGNDRISEYSAWGLFVRSWGWGVLDGSPELQVCEPAEPTDTPPPGLCRKGIGGGGKGQLNGASGIARDAVGNIYVFERFNLRVQKFSPEGQFIAMFGGKVNKTKVEGGALAAEQNRCPVDPGDECQGGTSGSASGYFAGNLFTDTIEYSETPNILLVGDSNRIQEFNLDGTFKGEIPFSGELAAFAGRKVEGLDVDSSGSTYLSISGLPDIYKLSAAGVPVDPGKPGESKFTASDPSVTTVDQHGNVFAVNGSQVLEYDAAAERLLPTQEEEEASVFFPNLLGDPQLFALTTNICEGSEEPGSLYVSAFHPSANQSYVDNYGPPPIGCEPPPSRPPLIVAQYSDSVRVDSARVRAEINPRFWADTTYFVQYGTGKCSEGGCDRELPLGPGALLTDEIVSKVLPPVSVVLQGLQPGTTYHFRFVANSGGGGPVSGEGGGEQLEPGVFRVTGGEDSFRTLALPGGPASCPANDQFRTGLSAALPDCRAYELVSPLDKENGDAALLPSAKPLELNQSALSGERFTYSSLTPFADPESSPFVSQYLAQRDTATGWSNEDISPPRTTLPFKGLGVPAALHNEFRAFSGNLCTSWLVHGSVTTLAPGAVPGYENLYRREGCGGAPVYEALSTTVPAGRPAELYTGLGMMGFSADESVTAFVSDGALTADAPPLNEALVDGGLSPRLQLFVNGPGGLRFACHLPSGAPVSTPCVAGLSGASPDNASDVKGSAVQGALSADGSRLYWSTFEGKAAENVLPGRIFLTRNPDQPGSAHLHGSGAGKGGLLAPAVAKCNTNKFAATVTACQWISGDFGPGQEVSGACLAAGTTVVSVVKGEAKMTLSAKPTATQSECQITGAASAVVQNVITEFGAFAPGQEFFAPGVPPGTTIEAVGGNTLTLSAQPTKTTTGASIEGNSECTEPDKACTTRVSEPVAGEAAAEYWGAASDGSRAIYRIAAGPLKGNVYEFDAASGASSLIAEGGLAPMGMSEDATRVYFASSKVLGEGASEGAEEGANNLYLYEAPEGGGEGSFSFIMGLAGNDLTGTVPRPSTMNAVPTVRSSKVSPDGLHAAFGSSAVSPTGYDNLDAEGGEPAEEVYVYDAASDALVCASCSPTGARPEGEDFGSLSEPIWVAARLSPPRTPLHTPRNLSDNGRRLFFESHDKLVPRDNNGTWDVYEWEAPGEGDCTTSLPTFGSDSGGCVDLISSGEGTAGARFLDADPSGSNVFIGTQASLVKADYGLNDVYDVRIDGGFPEPAAVPAECEGEACQGPAPPPQAITPASAAFRGPGNPPHKKGCPKGRHRVKRHGKVRCVKKRTHRKRHRHHRPGRRAAR